MSYRTFAASAGLVAALFVLAPEPAAAQRRAVPRGSVRQAPRGPVNRGPVNRGPVYRGNNFNRGYRGTPGFFYGYPGYFGAYSWGNPYWAPYGYSSFYGGGPWGWSNGYGFNGYGYGYGYGGNPYGGVRLDLPNRDAEVFVDGYFVGTVDDFDGRMQQANLESGPHRIEVKREGFEPIAFDVNVQPGRTITYRANMRPLP